jgi:hypothetical protein
MINSVTVTNHLDESITIELRFPEKSGFLVQSIEGLGPAKGDIAISKMAGIDGGIYNSARVNSRNVVLMLKFLFNPTIEDMRQLSYKYFPLKRKIKFRIDADNRSLEAYGYVESNEPDIFNSQEGTVISILFPESYLFASDYNITDFSSVNPLFEFPWSNESLVTSLLEFSELDQETATNIYYPGDAPIGLTIYIHANGAANDVSIINTETLETLAIDSAQLISITGSDIVEGDDIEISTVRGNKYATLTRGSTEYNILNALGQDPTWFQLEKGDNVYAFTADSGITNLQFQIINNIAYEGV